MAEMDGAALDERIARNGWLKRGSGRLGNRLLVAGARILLLLLVFVGGGAVRAGTGVLAWVPRWRQMRTLRQILRRHANTLEGQRLGLAEVRTYEEFRRRVPVIKYEDMRARVEASIESGTNHFFAGDIYSVTSTSGTTGRPKFILLGRELFRKEYLTSTLTTFFMILMRAPASMTRPLTIVAAASERHAKGRVTHVSSAGELYRTSIFRLLLAVPQEVLEISDWTAKYYYLCLFHLLSRSRCIITPNPTTIIEMIRVAAERWSDLLADAVAPELTNRFGLEAGLFDRLARNRRRYAPRVVERFDHCIHTVVTWMNGNCAFHAARLQERLHPGCKLISLGFLASDSPALAHVGLLERQVLSAGRVFAEFVDVTADETDSGAVPVPYHSLARGRYYRMIVTNHYGLYRYDLEDIFRVSGLFGRSPVLEFIRKSAGFSNITGEKLTEQQVIDAVEAMADRQSARVSFCIAVADVHDRSYVFYIEFQDGQPVGRPWGEAVASSIDTSLCCLNQEYSSKRASGRLGAPHVKYLRPDSLSYYRRALVAGGGRDAQLKVMPLQADARHRAILEALVLEQRGDEAGETVASRGCA